MRKEQGANVLASEWKVVGGELRVTPRPAVGWTAESWRETVADDADSIVVPWDPARGGVGYKLRGAEVTRRDLPTPRRR